MGAGWLRPRCARRTSVDDGGGAATYRLYGLCLVSCKTKPHPSKKGLPPPERIMSDDDLYDDLEEETQQSPAAADDESAVPPQEKKDWDRGQPRRRSQQQFLPMSLTEEATALKDRVRTVEAENAVLRRNMGTLYRTAAAELKRKDVEIQNLLLQQTAAQQQLQQLQQQLQQERRQQQQQDGR